MKIGIFTDDYFPRKDGVSYTVSTWKQRLEERGHDVKLVYPGSDSYEPEDGEIPVRSVRNLFYHNHYIGLPLGTSGFPEVDVIHVQSPGPVGMMARYYAHRTSTPCVFSFHTPLEDYIPHFLHSRRISKLLEKIYIWISNRFLGSFDAVTSNTADIRRDVKPEVVPAGIDTEFFTPSEEDFFIDTERPIVGYSGRVSEEKNLDQVVEMAEMFEGTVVIAGEGRHREELEEIAPGNVQFFDFIPRERLPVFLSSLDVFITASDSDTLCLSALEANSCGTPVVAPDIHPFTDTVDRRNGLKFEKDNLEDFYSKVEECLDRDLNPRSKAEEFSVDRTVEKLEEIYEKVS